MAGRTIKVELFEKQLEFLNSDKKETLFSGGVRSGKSVALCWALFRQACIPNNEVILIRKTYKSLKLSTLVTLLSGATPIMPKNTYVLNKAEGTIKVNNGGVIYCMGMDEPSRIRSINAGSIFVDEASEFNQEEYDELLRRLSNPVGSRQIYLATNPGTPSHFLYKRFFLTNSINRKVITVSSLENTALPQDYIDITLGEMDEQNKKRFVEGLWINFDGMIFANFDRNKHVVKLNPKEIYEEYFLAVDWGQTHPSAMLLVGKNKDRLYVLEEFYLKDPSLNTLRDTIQKYYNKYAGITLLYDPSAKILFNELANVGINLKKANNDVNGGINRVRTKLEIRNDSSDIVINTTCTNLCREFESYQYKPDSEIVKKTNDDLLDCLRYIVNEVDDLAGSYVSPCLLVAGNEGSEEDYNEIV